MRAYLRTAGLIFTGLWTVVGVLLVIATSSHDPWWPATAGIAILSTLCFLTFLRNP